VEGLGHPKAFAACAADIACVCWAALQAGVAAAGPADSILAAGLHGLPVTLARGRVGTPVTSSHQDTAGLLDITCS
jgi:hypothetical protein